MVGQGELEPGQEPPRERIYPPVGTLALDRFYDVLLTEAHSLRQITPQGGSTAAQPRAASSVRVS